MTSLSPTNVESEWFAEWFARQLRDAWPDPATEKSGYAVELAVSPYGDTAGRMVARRDVLIGWL
jgi:hypothetical protein